jgi:GTP-binding protein
VDIGDTVVDFEKAGDKSIILKPPQLTLEQALEYIEEDELVEVPPKATRLRKIYLKESDRRKQARQASS